MARVTVGIPSYNRPDGLDRAINQLKNQTYTDITILISDNCSTDKRVREIILSHESTDSRIKSFVQAKNIGAIENFKYLLRSANTEYFMWAADDDEWNENFIETCVRALDSHHDISTVMTGFVRNYTSMGIVQEGALPYLNGIDRYQDMLKFFEFMPQSIIYGLHRRCSINYIVDGSIYMPVFDDEYIVPRQILLNGCLTLPDLKYYTATIDEYPYRIKTDAEAPGKLFLHYKRFVMFIELIAEIGWLTDRQKLDLLRRYILMKINTLFFHEKEFRTADEYYLANVLHVFLDNIDVDKIEDYARLAKSFKDDARIR